MASIQFTDADRDERGFVKVPTSPPAEPRSLADLLPTPHSIQADAQRVQRQPPTKTEWAAMSALALLLIALLGYLWSIPAAPPPRPATIPATAQASGEGTTLPSPLPATAPAVAGRVLIAFAAPDGEVLGAIESTRSITPTAHYGDGWIQADVQGSGLVWLRASEVPELAITGPDLAPRSPAAAAPQSPPAAPAATATPEPPPCAEAGIAGKMVEVCGYDDLSAMEAQAKAKWIEQYGGNAGVVTTPSPQQWSRP